MGGGGGSLLRAAHGRLSVHQAPDTEGAACCLHCRALRWIELSPVSPVFGGLSPVRPGTENTRQGMDLAQIQAFVPGVPGVLRSYPEGSQPDSTPQPAACGLRWGWGACALRPTPCGRLLLAVWWVSWGFAGSRLGAGIGAGYRTRGRVKVWTRAPETDRLAGDLWQAKTTPRGFDGVGSPWGAVKSLDRSGPRPAAYLRAQRREIGRGEGVKRACLDFMRLSEDTSPAGP